MRGVVAAARERPAVPAAAAAREIEKLRRLHGLSNAFVRMGQPWGNVKRSQPALSDLELVTNLPCYHHRPRCRKAPQKNEVDRAGIEPATHGFSVRCSTN
jgi:hypothetical protein